MIKSVVVLASNIYIYFVHSLHSSIHSSVNVLIFSHYYHLTHPTITGIRVISTCNTCAIYM